MRTYLLGTSVLHAPEGGGGGGGDGGAGGSGGDGSGGAGGSGNGGGQAGGGNAPYRPEGLPDHLFGADAGDKGTIDKLWSMASGYQSRISQFGEIPDKADAYAFEPGEKLKPYATEFKGKLWDDVRTVAQKAGIGVKQFGSFMNGVIEAMIEGDMLEPPFDPAAEKKALLPESAKSLTETEQAAAIDKRMRDNMAWIEAMKARAPEGQKEAIGKALDFVLAELGDRANGHIAIEFLRGQIGSGPQPKLGGGAPTGLTREDLQKRKADPRADRMNAAYDPKFVDETERLYKELFGGQ